MWLFRGPKERREKCGNCNYWKPTDPLQKRGICSLSLRDPVNNWTSANDFCAAWTPRPQPREMIDSPAAESTKSEGVSLAEAGKEDIGELETARQNNQLETVLALEEAREVLESTPKEQKEESNATAIVGFVLGLLSLFIYPFI